MRRTGLRIWGSRTAIDGTTADFEAVFQNVLTAFDLGPGDFDVDRVLDELIGQMADHLGEKYDALAFEFTIAERRIVQPLNTVVTNTIPVFSPEPPISVAPAGSRQQERSTPPDIRLPQSDRETAAIQIAGVENRTDDERGDEDDAPASFETRASEPAQSSDRLQSIQRLVADHLGEELADFESNVLKAVPVQAGGLYPITDIWHIAPGLDEPERLRVHIAQFAREIADEAGLAEWIDEREDGIGFLCVPNNHSRGDQPLTPLSRGVVALLHALSAPYNPGDLTIRVETIHLVRDIGPLLQGWAQHDSSTPPAMRLSDNGLVKLFRLIRLARRLLELEMPATGDDYVAPRS